MLQNIVSQKNQDQKNAIDYVICAGGINDALNSDTLSQVTTNVESFINTAKANFPNAKVIVFPLHTFKSLNASALQKYQGIYETCANNGIMTTKNFIWWTICDQSIDDGGHVHLTTEGYQILGARILSFVLGGTNINEKIIPFTFADNVTGNIIITAKDNVLHAYGTCLLNINAPQNNTQLINLASYLTPETAVPVQHATLYYKGGARESNIQIDSGAIKTSMPDDYKDLTSGITVYINVFWEIGIDPTS